MKRMFVHGSLPHKIKGSVAAIGVFDGVHRGHQKVITRMVSEARRLSLPSVVVTFNPHPVEILQPRQSFSYIITLERRLQLIESLGVDVCVVVSFNQDFAAQDPRVFVKDFLVDSLGVKRLVLGSDFHFGSMRAGSLPLLKAMGLSYGFDVKSIPIKKIININIKSSYIKKIIAEGDLPALKLFLGRPYDFLGEIEHGEGRGRRLGYRTANFRKENVITLPSGIYFVTAQCISGNGRGRSDVLFGLCYVGRKPTFKQSDAPIVHELHILNLDEYLYGRKILMRFLKKHRDDMKFSDEKELVSQIAKDVSAARAYFRRFKK